MNEATETIRQYIGKDAKPEPLLCRGSDPIIFPNTINVVQGKTGAHKSRLTQQICATLISECRFGFGELFNLVADKNSLIKATVLYVDTERDIRYQLPQAMTQVIKMAGYSPENQPDKFLYTSVRRIPRPRRFEAVMQYIAEIRRKVKGHLFVVIDVITDFGDDFNDLPETYRFMDFLNSTSDQFDITFLAVIHENPNNTKARGHLGTELVNKATTLLQISQHGSTGDESVYQIDFKKTRATRPYKPLYVKYDTESKGLQTASQDEISGSFSSRASKITGSDLLAFLGTHLTQPTSKPELIQQIMDEFGCKGRIVEARLKEIVEGSQLVPCSEGEGYRLIKEATKPVKYRLEPLIP